MKKINSLFFFTIFIFLIIFNFCLKTTNAVPINGLDSVQHACLVGLFQVNGALASVNILGSDYNFCNETNGFLCSNSQVKTVTISNYATIKPSFNYNNLSCIASSITKLEIFNFDIMSFLTSSTVKIDTLNLFSCVNLYPLPIFKDIYSDVKISNNEYSYQIFSLVIDFSSIQNLKTFTLVDGLRSIAYSSRFGPPSSPPRLSSLKSVFSEIPDLTNMNMSISIFFTSNFNTSSYVNFKTFNLISSISFDSYLVDLIMPFPLELQNIPSSSKLNIFNSLNVCFQPINDTSEIADFSNLQNLNSFSIECKIKKMQKSYFPFKKLGTKPIVFLVFIDGYNFYPFSLGIFSNVKVLSIANNNITGTPVVQPNIGQYVDLSNNGLTGSLDDSYCSEYVNITNNIGVDNIPTCFSCHLNDDLKLKYFKNIGFNNKNKCSTIIPNLKISPSNSIVTMYGNDLGFDPSWFITTPSLYWERFSVKSGTYFTANYTGITGFTSLQTMNIQFPFPNLNFTVALSPTTPEIKSVKVVSEGSYDIYGKFFTYNLTDISIEIVDLITPLVCFVSFTSFDHVICSLSGQTALLESPIYQTNKLVIPIDNNGTDPGIQITLSSIKITVGFLSSKVYFRNQVGIENNLTCSSCATGEYCFINAGVCALPDPISTPTIDPTVPPGNCKNNCSNNGVCEPVLQQCSCGTGFSGDDCSGKLCPGSCGQDLIPIQGSCNSATGMCECNTKYIGSNCEFPNHFVSSNVPCSINGGIVSLFGWFGNNNTGLSVLIGESYCTVNSVNSSQIQCTIVQGSLGIKSINVTQNSLSWFGSGIYQYTTPTKQCSIPNCNNHGTCNLNTGKCECNNPYSGYDCMAIDQQTTNPTTTSSTQTPPPESKPNVNTTTGEAEIKNEQTKYKILLKSIVELDYLKNVVYEYLLDGKWSLSASTTGNSVLTNFTQTIKNTNTNNNDSIITSTIEDLSIDKNYTFAGIDFSVASGSIKVSVEILNWSFSNSLNTLQLRMESIVSNDNTNDVNNCNLENDNTNVSSDKLSEYNNLNNVKIEKNAKILYGRFLDRGLSDGRSTFITNQIVSNSSDSLIVGINLPHCISSCIIDPDFSVLVSSDFKSADSCLNNDSNRKWVLPVSIVVSVVGAACLAVIAVMVYRKNRTNIKIGVSKLKSIR